MTPDSGVPPGLTVLLGGARSGKSDLAVQIGERHCAAGGMVTFVATAQRFDDDMEQRIARHRAERPAWPTVEVPTDLLGALSDIAPDHLLIVDCLTLLVSNALLAGLSDDAVIQAAQRSSEMARARVAPTVVVSNEVGLGIHPETDLGRRYRDLLGRVNRQWTHAAHRSLFLIAGRALPLHDPWEFLT